MRGHDLPMPSGPQRAVHSAQRVVSCAQRAASRAGGPHHRSADAATAGRPADATLLGHTSEDDANPTARGWMYYVVAIIT